MLPVTAMTVLGSLTRLKMSGQSLSAISPGRLLPRPRSDPAKRSSLQMSIVIAVFMIFLFHRRAVPDVRRVSQPEADGKDVSEMRCRIISDSFTPRTPGR